MANWGGNHVEQALRLREAVRRLVSGGDPLYTRIEHAIRWLQAMLPRASIMPPKQVERLDFILAKRASVKSPDGRYFLLGNLSDKDKKAIVETIIALYEACLIDLGRLNDNSTAIIYDGWDERTARPRRRKRQARQED